MTKADMWDALIARLEYLESFDGNKNFMEETRKLVDEIKMPGGEEASEQKEK